MRWWSVMRDAADPSGRGLFDRRWSQEERPTVLLAVFEEGYLFTLPRAGHFGCRSPLGQPGPGASLLAVASLLFDNLAPP